jgi:hypothetical protein
MSLLATSGCNCDVMNFPCQARACSSVSQPWRSPYVVMDRGSLFGL